MDASRFTIGMYHINNSGSYLIPNKYFHACIKIFSFEFTKGSPCGSIQRVFQKNQQRWGFCIERKGEGKNTNGG